MKGNKKKNGFIATSLIYSFFLVFIAVVAAILNNYIATKTIMERYNLEAQKELNTDKHSVYIYSKNANIIDGITLTNLVSDGEFLNSNYWNIEPKYGISSSSYRFGTLYQNKSSFRKQNNGENFYTYQTVNLQRNSKYYFTITTASNLGVQLRTYLEAAPYEYIPAINSGLNWIKQSKIYQASSSTRTRFIVGQQPYSYSGLTYFTDAVVLNLTASFGAGYEPAKEWVDKHIDFFDGTRSFIKLDDVAHEDSISVKFNPFTGYRYANIDCRNKKTGSTISSSNYNLSTTTDADGHQYQLFKIKSVTSDIKCDVNWRR